MMDEDLYRASLRVASSILSGLASALLVGLPLSSNFSNFVNVKRIVSRALLEN